MQKKFKEKYNDGCIKVFKLLKLLYEDKAEYDDVIAIFSGDDAEKQHVTLNKFLNTLKIFGMKIQKSNRKYTTQNLPFSINFDIDDLKSIKIFEDVMKSLPAGKTKLNLKEFINLIESRFNEKTQLNFNTIKSNNNTDYTFFCSSLREQIEACEKYCQTNFKLQVKYLLNKEEITTICNAKQVIYDNKTAYLRVFRIKEQELEDIPVNNIIEVNQLPTQKNPTELTKTVVFIIKGRLAKAYNLKEYEYVREKREDGSLVIVNKNEPIDALLSRLMRYDYDCIVEGPLDIRNKMLTMINNTLKNYE